MNFIIWKAIWKGILSLSEKFPLDKRNGELWQSDAIIQFLTLNDIFILHVYDSDWVLGNVLGLVES